MHHQWKDMKSEINRRSFVKNGLSAAGIATAGVALLANGSSLVAEDEREERGSRLTRGDAALLRFAAAAEILETDFWVQYNELCGIPDSEVSGGSGNPAFTAALSFWTPIWPSMFMTIPMMNSLIKTFSTPILIQKAQNR